MVFLFKFSLKAHWRRQEVPKVVFDFLSFSRKTCIFRIPKVKVELISLRAELWSSVTWSNVLYLINFHGTCHVGGSWLFCKWAI